MKLDKQYQLTKFYPLQLTPKTNSRTIEPINSPTSTMKQSSIITFLQPNKTIEKKGRSVTSRRKDRSTHTENSPIVINNSFLQSHVSPSNKQTQTHLNHLHSYRQRPRNTFRPGDENSIKFKPHHTILNPYLQNLAL